MDYMKLSLDSGADKAGYVKVSKIAFDPALRSYCKANSCGNYGRNHTCPPGAGEIHALIDRMAQGGSGILLISSDLPEVINLSDRILVMRNGRLAGELPRAQAAQGAVLKLMAGVAA